MVRIYASSFISAATTGLWARIRDFGNVNWHPWVANCSIHQGQPSDRIGCIRELVLHDGTKIRHQLMALSDHQFYYTYYLLEASRPEPEHITTLKLTPITDSRSTFIELSLEFDVSLDRNVAQNYEEALRSGLDGLKANNLPW